jgi:hypothetical protein
MFVCCECCVLSGRGLCDGLITRPEESYRLWLVVVCDHETSKTRRLKPCTGLWKIQPQWVVTPRKQQQQQQQQQHCRHLLINWFTTNIYRSCREESAIHWENVPYVTLYVYNQTHLYPKLDAYGDNEKMRFKEWQLFTFTDEKFIFKRVGFCSFSNFNICI